MKYSEKNDFFAFVGHDLLSWILHLRRFRFLDIGGTH